MTIYGCFTSKMCFLAQVSFHIVRQTLVVFPLLLVKPWDWAWMTVTLMEQGRHFWAALLTAQCVIFVASSVRGQTGCTSTIVILKLFCLSLEGNSCTWHKISKDTRGRSEKQASYCVLKSFTFSSRRTLPATVFFSTGVWTQDLHLEPLHSPFLWWIF
jgi:hypothetical protein